jgi:16S rRNA (guanine527-N7)-methyltransferase
MRASTGRDERATLAERFAYELSARQLDQLARLLAALQADEHAPTAVRDAARARDVHVADSLAALELAPLRTAQRIADLGAGAGFPGLALAIARPEMEVNLIESQRRRCDFIARLCAAGEIANAVVVCTRVEQWREGVGRQDVALARALASQPVVLEYAAPLLRRGGALIDWRGRRDAREEEAAARTAPQLGLSLEEIRPVRPFAGARERHLHLYLKVGETPPRFPRRTGVARKRPLAGSG